MRALVLTLLAVLSGFAESQNQVLLLNARKPPSDDSVAMAPQNAAKFFAAFDRCDISSMLSEGGFETAGVRLVPPGLPTPEFIYPLFDARSIVFASNKSGKQKIKVPAEGGEDDIETYIFTDSRHRYHDYQADYPRLARAIRLPTGEKITGIKIQVAMTNAAFGLGRPEIRQVETVTLRIDRYRGPRFIERLSYANGGYMMQRFTEDSFHDSPAKTPYVSETFSDDAATLGAANGAFCRRVLDRRP